SPTETLVESPTDAVARPEAPCNWSTATSRVRPYPTTVASYVRPSPTSVARMVVPPSITRLLVSTRPDAGSTMPVPAAALPRVMPRVTLMLTTDGSTALAIEDRSPGTTDEFGCGLGAAATDRKST